MVVPSIGHGETGVVRSRSDGVGHGRIEVIKGHYPVNEDEACGVTGRREAVRVSLLLIQLVQNFVLCLSNFIQHLLDLFVFLFQLFLSPGFLLFLLLSLSLSFFLLLLLLFRVLVSLGPKRGIGRGVSCKTFVRGGCRGLVASVSVLLAFVGKTFDLRSFITGQTFAGWRNILVDGVVVIYLLVVVLAGAEEEVGQWSKSGRDETETVFGFSIRNVFNLPAGYFPRHLRYQQQHEIRANSHPHFPGWVMRLGLKREKGKLPRSVRQRSCTRPDLLHQQTETKTRCSVPPLTTVLLRHRNNRKSEIRALPNSSLLDRGPRTVKTRSVNCSTRRPKALNCLQTVPRVSARSARPLLHLRPARPVAY